MKHLNVNYFLLMAVTLLTSPFCLADQELDRCIKNVNSVKSGYILKLEKLNFSNKGVYEFEILDPERNEWEFLCEAKTGKIIEQESEAQNPDHPAFKKNVKISEQDAAKTALKAFPGKIEEVEYEIENNGDSTYEFDIVNPKGIEIKVEVDAASGKIIESAFEDWQIGEEHEENR